jgi:hypothetical protein
VASVTLLPGFYAAFYKGTRPGLQGLFNRAVRWWDNGRYSHCELVFSDGLSASSSFIDGGVRFKAIDYDNERWDIVQLPAQLEADARAWFEEHRGAGYGVMANVRFVLDFLSAERKQFNCSGAFAAALGVTDSWRFTPNMLAALLHSRAWFLSVCSFAPVGAP